MITEAIVQIFWVEDLTVVKSRTQEYSICFCGPHTPEPTGGGQSESRTGQPSPSLAGYQPARARQGAQKNTKMKSAPDGSLKTKGQKGAPDEFMKIKGLRDISSEARI